MNRIIQKRQEAAEYERQWKEALVKGPRALSRLMAKRRAEEELRWDEHREKVKAEFRASEAARLRAYRAAQKERIR